MDCITQRIPYRQTGCFTPIILDYLDHAETLKPFYANPASLQGIQKAIEEIKKFTTNRKVIVEQLKKQYETVNVSETAKEKLEALLSENTFTITTAHQPNIFTGPIYFI